MNTIKAKRDASTRAPRHGGYFTLPYLRAWREYVGVTRPEVVRATGISLSMLLQVELRGQRVSGRYLDRIADVFGVPSLVLATCSPLDRGAQRWARKAAIAFAAQRLAKVS